MFYRAGLQSAAALASLSLLAGCGLLSDSSAETNQQISVGTTSSPSTLDPAAAWDGSWELMRNVFQTLVSFPTGSMSPRARRGGILPIHRCHEHGLPVHPA
ncbi:ABC-type transport system substrate-binding protein [Streptomyces sp. B1I3]|nr:ABC-type transport system substrate-binding protein [Streptomyces sp. B1I3]